ncbi:hypothetical protein GWI33_021511 [Rhynchophorus ferrugineus]|uniref:Secreted protein n=1 Tax=Rhynchophorus ferrugineus TaxID=354439 RepID=A0A834IRB2_RHYFE|nr:hypothetical protein GWI33_021511 [Rhynchophorus ferrugineus]
MSASSIVHYLIVVCVRLSFFRSVTVPRLHAENAGVIFFYVRYPKKRRKSVADLICHAFQFVLIGNKSTYLYKL